jgi:hypothetical protein
LILAACFVPNVEMFLGYNVAERLKSFSGGDNSKTASVVEGETKVERVFYSSPSRVGDNRERTDTLGHQILKSTSASD